MNNKKDYEDDDCENWFDHTESDRLEQLLFSWKITFEEFCEAVELHKILIFWWGLVSSLINISATFFV